MLHALFRSRVRAKLISHLFANPSKRFFARQLEGILNESQGNISRELSRLQSLGIISVEREGRQKFYKANDECPIFAELRGIVIKTTGLADVLRNVLAPLARKIGAAFVYGSMASGEAGPQSDVDLMVIGDIDEMKLHTAVSKAEQRLGRMVNYTLLNRAEFQKRRKERSGFLSRALRGAKIMIIGSADEIR